MAEAVRRLDPVEVFQEQKERDAKVKELTEHVWTLDEVEKREAEAAISDEANRGWQAVKSFAETSEQRGDFVRPWNMSRADARAYLDSKGVPAGAVYSHADELAVAHDPKLREEYGAELDNARIEGRVIRAPKQLVIGRRKNKKQQFERTIIHFKGEGPFDENAHTKHLNKTLAGLDKQRGEKLIAETIERANQMRAEGKPFEETFAFFSNLLSIQIHQTD